MKRVLLTAFFVVSGLLLYIGLMIFVFPHTTRTEDIFIEIGLGLLFVLLLVVAVVFFDDIQDKWKKPYDPEQEIRDLQEKGLLVSTDYQATRAFQVEEYEDEGLHYFVELMDGSVLYLTGQNLYDYEPIVDDPKLNQPRRFPCTDFSLRTHRDEKFTVDIVCQGTVFEAEEVVLHPKNFWKREINDGQIINDMSFDEIKTQLSTESRHR